MIQTKTRSNLKKRLLVFLVLLLCVAVFAALYYSKARPEPTMRNRMLVRAAAEPHFFTA